MLQAPYMTRHLFALIVAGLLAPFTAGLAAEQGAPAANPFYAMDTSFQRPGLRDYLKTGNFILRYAIFN